MFTCRIADFGKPQSPLTHVHLHKLPDGCGDSDYLESLERFLHELDSRFTLGLVLYLAGADTHEGDQLGRLKLTDHRMMVRDRRVLDWRWPRRIPCALAMGGHWT
jgi:acetoin utilization deacetylase AcuC-like enzyme